VEKVTCVHQKKLFEILEHSINFFLIDKKFENNLFDPVSAWKKSLVSAKKICFLDLETLRKFFGIDKNFTKNLFYPVSGSKKLLGVCQKNIYLTS